MKKIALLSDQNTLFHDLETLLFDHRQRRRYDSLSDYFEEKKWGYSPEELEHVVRLIEEQLYAQCRYFCHLLFYIMDKSGQWGEAGEQQVKVSFCRLLLGIPPEEAISHMQAFEFMEKAAALQQELGIDGVSLEDARKEMEAFEWRLFGHGFSIHEITELNDILRFVGSSRVLQGGTYGHDRELIYGEGTRERRGDYQVYFIRNELMRTPNTIVAMAAVIGDREIFLRRESLETIFFQKWVPVTVQGAYFGAGDVFFEVSDAIKRHTIGLYDPPGGKGFTALQDVFISDMADTILCHEIGHGIIQYHTFSVETGSFAEATKITGENIFTALLEFLADYAPDNGEVRGTLANMAQAGKNDRVRGERMFYMYLSDTWFYDTDDLYMYLYSDLMSLSLSSFMLPDKSVDFDGLGESTDGTPGSLTRWALDKAEAGVRIVKGMLESARFIMADKPDMMGYEEAILEAQKEIELQEWAGKEDVYNRKTALYSTLLDGYQKVESQKAELAAFYERFAQECLAEFFALVTGQTIQPFSYAEYRRYVAKSLQNLFRGC